MAEMVPERIPDKASQGEKRLFAALEKLDDTCIVYYEAIVRNRHPDFIVIMPDAGVLVIEVKGVRMSELLRADDGQMTVKQYGQERIVPHPLKQAQEYMFSLMDECTKFPQASKLMHADGRYKNRFRFPFGHMAVLSNIQRRRLEESSFSDREIFSPNRVVMAEELDALGERDPAELKAALKTFFDPWWTFEALSASEVNILRALIHPEIVIRQTAHDLKTLDLRQERYARKIGNGHRIIRGVAGSGKTVILIARAKLIAEDREKQVLVLCRNKGLKSNFETAFRGRKNIRAYTFHGWGCRNGIGFDETKTDEEFGDELFHCLQSSARDNGCFDAVLIDEAQDIPCSWFQSAKLALKEPETGDLFIVGDGSQALYKRRPFSWKDAGIHAQGHSIHKKFGLDRNYRNTVQILRAAHTFAATPENGEDGESKTVLALAVNPESAVREGPEPHIRKLASREKECDYAAALIETWLLGGVELLGRLVRPNPSDIAILYPRLESAHKPAMTRMKERLDEFTRAVTLSGKYQDGTLDDGGVRILTMKAAPGLQFRCVVLLWTDLLPRRLEDNRSELYVAMTRAEDILVILHSGSSPYVDEVRRNAGRADEAET